MQYGFVSNGTCESNGMKSIHDTINCEKAAMLANKTFINVIIKEDFHGYSRPTGCSWHEVGNLELWKSSNGNCTVNDYAGCFCIFCICKTSSKS